METGLEKKGFGFHHQDIQQQLGLTITAAAIIEGLKQSAIYPYAYGLYALKKKVVVWDHAL